MHEREQKQKKKGGKKRKKSQIKVVLGEEAAERR